MTQGVPFLDERVIAHLAELGKGDEAFANKPLIIQLMSTYLDKLPVRLSELTAAVMRGDASGIEHSAHTLKTSSGIIGLAALAANCQSLEDLAISSRLEGCPAALQQVTAACQRVPEVLKRRMRTLEAS
ncbi:Hpt domain-containing protein [Myxococcaceae bacterium GXIMD 01537]